MRRFLCILGMALSVACVPAMAHTTRSHHVTHRRIHRAAKVHRPHALPPIPWAYQPPQLADTAPANPVVDHAAAQCLAEVILHEARGESRRGQIAVANVVVNRTKYPEFGSTVCGVVHQSVRVRGKRYCQFSWVCHPRRIVVKPEERRDAKMLAILVLTNQVKPVARTAVSFHARRVRVRECRLPLTIGGHVFCAPSTTLAKIHEPDRLPEPVASL